MIRAIILCGALLAAPRAAAGNPHFAGTWKGTAERTICGKAVASQQITLVLEDRTRTSPDDASAEVGGQLIIGSKTDGDVSLHFDAKTGTLSSTLGSVGRTPGSPEYFISNSNATYWLNLTAGDAWAGVGYFQSLSGRLTKPDFSCSVNSDRLDVLTVKLKKQ
jgi:hypothetical protein